MALRDIIGQERVIRILRGMLKKGRLPHALLFTGEPGVGKLSTAKNLLKTLNCTSLTHAPENLQFFGNSLPPSQSPDIEYPDACDHCRTCQLIDTFNFADLLYIKPEDGQIKIDTIREVTRFLSMSPYEAKIKMVIIDEAEKLNINAANAFLKTLEEPPQDSLIILISEKPDLLPDTIRSRCVKLHFSPLNSAQTFEVIKRLQRENQKSQGFLGAESGLPEIPPLFIGRPGMLEEEELHEYSEAVRTLMHLSKRFHESRNLRSGTIVPEIEKEPTREEILKIMDIALVYLRDMIAEIISGAATVTSATNEPMGDVPKLILTPHQPPHNGHPENLSKKIFGEPRSHSRKSFGTPILSPSKSCGMPSDIQVIIENYRKLFHLKQLMQFNLNTKITWNYLVAILEDTITLRHRGILP